MITAFIYALKDPRDNTVHYVGKTLRPKSRLARHLYLKFETNLEKRAWLEELATQNLEPELIILEQVEILMGSHNKAEIRWIRELADKGEPLTNLRGLTMP